MAARPEVRGKSTKCSTGVVLSPGSWLRWPGGAGARPWVGSSSRAEGADGSHQQTCIVGVRDEVLPRVREIRYQQGHRGLTEPSTVPEEAQGGSGASAASAGRRGGLATGRRHGGEAGERSVL